MDSSALKVYSSVVSVIRRDVQPSLLGSSRTFLLTLPPQTCAHLQPPAAPLSCGSACSGRLLEMGAHALWPLVSPCLTRHHVSEAQPRGSACRNVTTLDGRVALHGAAPAVFLRSSVFGRVGGWHLSTAVRRALLWSLVNELLRGRASSFGCTQWHGRVGGSLRDWPLVGDYQTLSQSGHSIFIPKCIRISTGCF